MKTHFVLFNLLFAFSALSQDPDSITYDNKVLLEIGEPAVVNDLIYVVVEKMPEYPEGREALLNFLNKNLKYPSEDIKHKIEGTVYLAFIIGKSGKIRDVKILKGVSRNCDAEAVRLIKLMPNWIPGEQSGEAVDVRYSLPIRFKLSK